MLTAKNETTVFKIWFSKIFFKHQFHHWLLRFIQKWNFVSVQTNFVGGPLYFRNVMLSNFFWIIGVSRFFNFFLSHTRRGAILCFRMFRVSKNFMPKRGISRLCFEKLLSHSTEKIRRWTLLSVTKWYPKNSWQRGGREYHNFSSKIFCLTVLKNFVGESFIVSLISGIENVWDKS